jgi:hypothetical protein
LALIDAQIRAKIPGVRLRRISDGGGLLLEIDPRGGKYWLWRYRYPPTKDGKQLSYRIGPYPEVANGTQTVRTLVFNKSGKIGLRLSGHTHGQGLTAPGCRGIAAPSSKSGDRRACAALPTTCSTRPRARRGPVHPLSNILPTERFNRCGRSSKQHRDRQDSPISIVKREPDEHIGSRWRTVRQILT